MGTGQSQNRIRLSWLTCDDRGGMCVTMSRIVPLMCHKSPVLPACVVTVWASQQRPIQYHQITTRKLPKLHTFFSRFQFIFEIKHLVCLRLKNECRRLLWFMKIQCGSVENYIWFTAWDEIPTLVVRSNYKPAFWPGLNFYHRWVYLSSSKMYFPAWGWVESIRPDVTGLSGLEA